MLNIDASENGLWKISVRTLCSRKPLLAARQKPMSESHLANRKLIAVENLRRICSSRQKQPRQ